MIDHQNVAQFSQPCWIDGSTVIVSHNDSSSQNHLRSPSNPLPASNQQHPHHHHHHHVQHHFLAFTSTDPSGIRENTSTILSDQKTSLNATMLSSGHSMFPYELTTTTTTTTANTNQINRECSDMINHHHTMRSLNKNDPIQFVLSHQQVIIEF